MRKRGILVVIMAGLVLLSGCMAGNSAGIKVLMPASEEPPKKGRLQDQGDGTCLDSATGKLWQVTRSKRIKSLESANQYTQELRLASHSDWRLPTLAELYDVFLYLDRHKENNCLIKFESNYWSRDADKKGHVGAWELDGICYPEREYFSKKEGYIRAVRP